MDGQTELDSRGFVYGAVSDADIPEWCRGLPELTRRLMEAHYMGSRESVPKFLAPDLYWIGSMEWQMKQGLDNVLAELRRDAGIPRVIQDTEFRVVYADPYCCTVSGWMKAKTPESSGMLLAALQRVTFQYALFDGEPKAVHIHISNSWDAAEPDEQFPFRAGRETYQYVQDMLRRKQETPKKIAVKDVRGSTHYLQVDEIMFIEAQKPHAVLHCVDGRIEVYSRMSDLAAALPSFFLTIHRSYIVNVNYVVGISRFTLHLCEGRTLPVPEKRYSELKRQLETRLLGPKKK